MGILGLYEFRSAALYGSESADLLKVSREVAGEWMSAWVSRLLRVAWPAQRTPTAGKTGGGRDAYLYDSGAAVLMKGGREVDFHLLYFGQL